MLSVRSGIFRWLRFGNGAQLSSSISNAGSNDGNAASITNFVELRVLNLAGFEAGALDLYRHKAGINTSNQVRCATLVGADDFNAPALAVEPVADVLLNCGLKHSGSMYEQ